MLTPVLSIIVIIVGAVVAITEKKDAKYKNILVLLYVISSFAAIYLIVIDFLDKIEEDKQKIIQSNKIDNIEYTTSDMNLKIDSLDKKTIAALIARESSIVSFNEVTEKLNKQIEFEELDIQSKRPKIEARISDMKFIDLNDSITHLEVRFLNMGTRPASNFKIKGAILYGEKFDVIHNYQVFDERPPNNNIYSLEETNTHSTITLNSLNRKLLYLKNGIIFLFFVVNYEDNLLRNSYTELLSYEYENGKIRKYRGEYKVQIESYLEDKAITNIIMRHVLETIRTQQ
jgi:hypothetical protein